MLTPSTGSRTRSSGVPPQPRDHTLIHRYRWGTSTSTECKALPLDPWTEVIDSVSYDDKSDYTVMTDVVTPNFRRRIKAGELILNPMSKVRTIVEIPDGSSRACTSVDPSKGGNLCYKSTQFYGGPCNLSKYYLDLGKGPELPSLEPMVDSDAQLLLAAVSRVDPTAFHTMEDVLQLRQFSQSILHPIEGMKKVVWKLKSHRQSTRNLGVAEAWAKYRFEFLPLLGTAEALIRTALGHTVSLKKDIRLRSTAITAGNDRKCGVYYNDTGQYGWNVDLTQVIRKRAVVFYKLRTDHAGLSQTLGTRFKDLPTGMWNIVPYSFIIDRVINISQFLTAVSNLCDPTIMLEGACITTKDYVRSSIQLSTDISPARTYTFETKPVTVITDSHTRTIENPYTAASPLSLDLRPLDLVKNMSRATDLLALIILGMKRT